MDSKKTFDFCFWWKPFLGSAITQEKENKTNKKRGSKKDKEKYTLKEKPLEVHQDHFRPNLAMAEKINQKEVLEHINKNREKQSQKETGKDRERETHTRGKEIGA